METVLKTASAINPTINVSFPVRGSADGTTLSVTGTTISVTDSTFASGSVGFFIHSGGGSTPVH